MIQLKYSAVCTQCYLSSNSGVAGICSNTTLVVFISGHPDVSRLTPASSPAVCLCVCVCVCVCVCGVCVCMWCVCVCGVCVYVVCVCVCVCV